MNAVRRHETPNRLPSIRTTVHQRLGPTIFTTTCITRVYTREDNICASIAVVGIVCLTSHLSQHRRRLPRLFAIKYLNENYSLHPGINDSFITFVFKFLFGNVILITYRCTYIINKTQLCLPTLHVY